MKTNQTGRKKDSLRRDFNTAFKKFAAKKRMRTGLPRSWKSMRFMQPV